MLTTPAVLSLQWGRDQLIAELLYLAAEAAREAMLQWGRDQLIAELVPPVTRAPQK